MTISDAVWFVFAFALLYVVFGMPPAAAQTEREYVEHLCAGMKVEVPLDDGTRLDCESATTAWEVGFSDTWAQSIGQSLHYARMTGKRPGVLLICRNRPETCRAHLRRVLDTIAAWRLPVAVWMHSGGLPE